MSLNIWVPGGLLGTVVSLPSKCAADTWQMGNYTAWDPCLLLSFSCGKGGQKLDLKWLPGGGRTAESVLGLLIQAALCWEENGKHRLSVLHKVVFEGWWQL